MVINKVAVGNNEEAYVETRLKKGFNIISSDDNNKGKTIVVQSIMYTLGNIPAFPASFEYDKYRYYIEFEVDGIIYHLCRMNETFALKYEKTLMFFDSISELKHYWTKHIYKLPVIVKNEISKIVDPELFLQLFFVGQDKKETSDIANHGLYNKQDFYNMIYDIIGASGIELTSDEISRIKSEISLLTNEKKELLKEFSILKSNKLSVEYLSSTNDRTKFAEKIKELDKIRAKIEELRKTRNRDATRCAKWKSTIKELKSLNRIIPKGELRCMDCNSTNISFSTSSKNGYCFDVSTIEMRNDILNSIEEKIRILDEEVEHTSYLIELEQEKLKGLMTDKEVTLEAILACKDEVLNASDTENKIQEITRKIEELKSQLSTANDTQGSKKQKQQEIIKRIVDKMNNLYSQIDPMGNQVYEDLFSKKSSIYSGSDETIFHELKLYSFSDVLKLPFPIIIDSFRAEDLSSQKEDKILELFCTLNNQMIFTTTLKDEEIGKYDELKNINHIDYSSHTPSKILSKAHKNDFDKLISIFNLKIE